MSDLAVRRLEQARALGEPGAAEALARWRCRRGLHDETWNEALLYCEACKITLRDLYSAAAP